jgi:hypothetical protein
VQFEHGSPGPAYERFARHSSKYDQLDLTSSLRCRSNQATNSATTKSLSLLSAGGMGEVYRARETKLSAMSPGQKEDLDCHLECYDAIAPRVVLAIGPSLKVCFCVLIARLPDVNLTHGTRPNCPHAPVKYISCPRDP